MVRGQEVVLGGSNGVAQALRGSWEDQGVDDDTKAFEYDFTAARQHLVQFPASLEI